MNFFSRKRGYRPSNFLVFQKSVQIEEIIHFSSQEEKCLIA
jgi:hypothetical protein